MNMKIHKPLSGIWAIVLGLCNYVNAQNAEPSALLKQDMNAGEVFDLFEISSIKMQGKAAAYRLIGTSSKEGENYVDSNQVYYSGTRGSVSIPPMISFSIMDATSGFVTTYYDSNINYMPNIQAPPVWSRARSFYYLFDNQERITEYGSEIFGTRNRSVYTYNTNDKILTIDDETLAGGTWDPLARTYFVHQTQAYTKYKLHWNVGNSAWDTVSKEETTVYPNELTDSIVAYSKTGGVWSLSGGEAYDYDAGGRITRKVSYGYDPNSQGLIAQLAQVITYTAGGDMDEFIRYNGAVGVTPNFRTKMYYTGTRVDSIQDFSWNTGSSSWVPAFRAILSYSGGLLVKKETSSFNGTDFEPMHKLEFTSDGNQNIETATFFLWMDNNQSWTEGEKHTYYYEEYQSPGVGFDEIEENVSSIYPNPGSGMFKLDMPVDGTVSLEVYGMDGRKVHQMEITGNKGEVKDFSLDVPAGIYFFQVQAQGEKALSGKLVVN